jgi:hypothetical protein
MPRSAPSPTTVLAGFRRAAWQPRLAALAGILAVLLQGALPIAHPAGMASASERRYADYLSVFGAAATVSLCSTDDAARGGDRPARPGPSHHLASCPICLAAQHATGFLPPVGAVTPAPLRSFATVVTAMEVAPRAVATATAAQPRAPPLAV